MSTLKWDFPLLGSGNEQGYTNSGIETFTGQKLMENVAREICQNSLDAKEETQLGPVHVTFKLDMIPSSDPVFMGYKECIEGCRQYWDGRMDDRLREFLIRADKALSKEKIPVLVAGDFNTPGLTGARAERRESSVWRALAHSDGTSVNKQGGSAGSFGIGKNAPFACSDLSMVFYNSFAIDEVKAFQGVSRLATIYNAQEQPTQGTGHYHKSSGPYDWSPIFPNDDCPFRDRFHRDQYGTDIIIAGFSEVDSWEADMLDAVLSNFLLAIHENKMTVSIQGKDINALNLGSLIERRSKEKNTADMRNTAEWYAALTDPDDIEPIKLSVMEENDVELFIKADNNYHRNVSHFRSTGMLIRKYRKDIMQNFAAVVRVTGIELNKLLRKAEPPRHDRWDPSRIEDKEMKKLARELLDKMDRLVLDELKKKYETVHELTMDSGEGHYLPDDVDDMGRAQPGEDILRVNQKVRTVVRENRIISTQSSGSKDSQGSIVQGDVYSDRSRKTRTNDKTVVSGAGTSSGMDPDRKGSMMRAINIVEQRAFAISTDNGLYKLIMKSDAEYESVFISFSSIGEDNSRDTLDIEGYSVNGKWVNTSQKKMGPVDFKCGEPLILIVRFKEKEKMILDVYAERRFG